MGPVSAAIGIACQPHPGIGPQIGDEHLVVGMPGALVVQIEGIIVLHQEFPAAHHPKARTHLIPELPLDVVEVLGQIPIAVDLVRDDIGDHLFRRGPKSISRS